MLLVRKYFKLSQFSKVKSSYKQLTLSLLSRNGDDKELLRFRPGCIRKDSNLEPSIQRGGEGLAEFPTDGAGAGRGEGVR